MRGKASKHSGHTSSPAFDIIWSIKEPCTDLGFEYHSQNSMCIAGCVCVHFFLFLNNLSRDVHIMSNSGLRSEKFKQVQKLFWFQWTNCTGFNVFIVLMLLAWARIRKYVCLMISQNIPLSMVLNLDPMKGIAYWEHCHPRHHLDDCVNNCNKVRGF